MILSLYNFYLTKTPKKKESHLSGWLQWQLYKYVKANLVRYYKRISSSALGVDHTSDVIVSLTSFPARITVVHLAIKSMLNQTEKPKKIVLWLGKDYFPLGEDNLPSSLLELKPLGLDIAFCEDLKAHTKYFYAFQKYPNNLIVTVDDDIIYPKNLLSTLLETQQQYPNCVVANRVRNMKIENDSFKSYRQWGINELNNLGPSKKLFATGVGGVLYQPSFFLKSFFDIESIKNTNCIGDDIWLKAGQIVNNIPVVFTNYYFKPFIEIPESQNESLNSKNVFGSDNDRQVKTVFEHFGITSNSFE